MKYKQLEEVDGPPGGSHASGDEKYTAMPWQGWCLISLAPQIRSSISHPAHDSGEVCSRNQSKVSTRYVCASPKTITTLIHIIGTEFVFPKDKDRFGFGYIRRTLRPKQSRLFVYACN